MQGMSGANMKLCVVRIDLADDAPEPVAEPDDGEFIEKHLVPVNGLMNALLGMSLVRSPFMAGPVQADRAYALPFL